MVVAAAAGTVVDVVVAAVDKVVVAVGVAVVDNLDLVQSFYSSFHLHYQ